MIANSMANLGANVHGIAPEDYKDVPLPEDFEIVELLSNVIAVEYADVASDGKSLMRNGIILPNQVVDHRAWRIARVKITGPNCKQVKVGDIVMFPGDRGLQSIQKNGVMLIFLSEERIFGICKPIKDGTESKVIKNKNKNKK
jgi:co-chaperonin GroES (HSP10)